MSSTLSNTRAYDVESKLIHNLAWDASWYGNNRIQAVCGATVQGLDINTSADAAKVERDGGTNCPNCELHLNRRSLWTIAFRKRTANRFQRVTNWSGSWDDACRMAGVFGEAHPELEIYITTTREAEESGYSSEEDHGNILTDAGKRIRVTDNAELSEEVISAFVKASGWVENKGRPGHFYMIVPNTDDHIICTNKAHTTNGAAFACAFDAIWSNMAHAQKEIERLDAIDHGHAVEVMTQVVDNGRDDLTWLLDTIDAANSQAPDGRDSTVPSAPGCEKCSGSTGRCDACMLAWLVGLYNIRGAVKLSKLPVVPEFDCV